MLSFLHTTIAILFLSLYCFTNAQIPTLPACAVPCITNAVANATTCDSADTACQCTTSNQALIEAAATSCVLENCGTDGIKPVLQAAQAICSAALASSLPTGLVTTPAPSSPLTVPSAAATISLAAASTYPDTAQPTSVPVPTTQSCGCVGEPTSSYSVVIVLSPTTAMATVVSATNGSATAIGSPVQVTGAAVRAVGSVGVVMVIGLVLLAGL